ncbi:MAG TPA: OsmC family peroxiredoxin [Gemmatimonadales bacterium]|jgi:osmotically inducible protein OsmC
MTVSTASATWEGGLKAGKGSFKGASGLIQGPYTFATRFESAKGTNPEELIAAAHASCLSMALSAGLEQAGKTPTRISTTAACTMAFVDGAPRITTMKLTVRGVVPGIDQAAFARAAEEAKIGCPVSNLMKGNIALELDARLE